MKIQKSIMLCNRASVCYLLKDLKKLTIFAKELVCKQPVSLHKNVKSLALIEKTRTVLLELQPNKSNISGSVASEI